MPAGFAVLRYDRRGSGASEGDFMAADFAQLAADCLAAVALAAAQPEVDPGLIGLFGFSQGGWIGPEAASRSDEVAFMVLVGACAVTPAEQMRYVTEDLGARSRLLGSRGRACAGDAGRGRRRDPR